MNNPSEKRDAATPDSADARISQPDTAISIILPALPDTRSPRDAMSTGPDGATVTIQDIMDSCNISALDQAGVLNCLATLRASWTTGVSESLAGADCNSVEYALSCFLQGNCWGPPSSQDFDPNGAFYCPPVIIYAGVRFV
jgi:hypothetical protein